MRRLIRLLALVAGLMIVVTLPRMWDLVQLSTGWALPARAGGQMLIVAHRGDLQAFPEDTAEAILAAAGLAAEGIEFDVHQSADGTWYVIHDATLDRTTDASGAVADLPDRVIDAAVIDGGLGYDSARHRNLHVPRLEAVLAALGDYPGIIYLDLQHTRKADASALALMVQDRRAVVICRSDDDAMKVKAVSAAIGTIARPGWSEAPNLDGWLEEAMYEATPGSVASSALPVTTYVEQSHFGEDEYPLLRRAWAIGVSAFLSKNVPAAIAYRGRLVDAR